MTNLILTLLAMALIWIAISAASKSGVKNPIDAVQHISGFTTSIILIMALLVFAMPRVVGYLKNEALPKYWGPVFTELWDDGLEAQTTAADFMNGRNSLSRPQFTAESYTPPIAATPIVTNPQADVVAAVENTPAEPVVVQSGISHTVQAGDTLKKIADQYSISVEEIVTKNGISNPNSISVGDTFIIQDEVVVVPTAAPVVVAIAEPTATLRPDFSDQFNLLEIAKREGNIDTAVQIINSILQVEPDNIVARGYQAEINLAYDVAEDWNTLAVNVVSGPSQAEIESYLAGFEFRVKSIENDWNAKTKREEEMVLICTSLNWLNGQEVTISRFAGERMGFYNADDKLTVGG